jgi:hypothetical protein
MRTKQDVQGAVAVYEDLTHPAPADFLTDVSQEAR